MKKGISDKGVQRIAKVIKGQEDEITDDWVYNQLINMHNASHSDEDVVEYFKQFDIPEKTILKMWDFAFETDFESTSDWYAKNGPSHSDKGVQRIAKVVESQDEEQISIPKEAITEARNHLYAAIAQSIPEDDQIIMDHVRDAYDILDSMS